MMTERAYQNMIEAEEARFEMVEDAQAEETTVPGCWIGTEERDPYETGRYLVRADIKVNGVWEEYFGELDFTFFYDNFFNEVDSKWGDRELEKNGCTQFEVYEWTTIKRPCNHCLFNRLKCRNIFAYLCENILTTL